MPALTVSENITFEYTDSGPVDDTSYTTYVVIHGHSYHSGTFKHLLPVAPSRGVRIIVLNRRGFLGSTPYTDAELDAITTGTEEQRNTFLRTQGTLLCLFLDGVIQKHALPRDGGIALVAWSMGNIFALCTLSVLSYIPETTRERLRTYVHSYIAWDPPSAAYGIADPPDSYIPLWDTSLPAADRRKAFAVWVSGYFTHGALSSHDFSQLNQRTFDGDTSARPPTLRRIAPAEFAGIADIAAGGKYDSPLIVPGAFEALLKVRAERVLFAAETQAEWDGLHVCLMYGDAVPWPIIHTAWTLEGMGKAGDIKVKLIPGANHFLMWDDPKKAVDTFKECSAK